MTASTLSEHGPGGGRGRAFVTGASSGIGRAFAERFAADGLDLFLTARRTERLEELGERLRTQHGIHVTAVSADLTDRDQLDQLEEHVAAAQDLTVLVNNAGASTFGRFADLDRAGEQAQIDLLVTPVVRLTHAALPGLLARGGGRVIQVSSRAALVPHFEIATYSGAKAFLNAFTTALAADPSNASVRFLCLCPGLVRTELFERAGIDVSGTDPRSWSEPEEVVAGALRDLDAGELISIPGEVGRGEWLRRIVPQPWLRRAAGVLRRLARV